MVNQERETAVIFLHIPKTAGTTLIEIIERHYLPRYRYHLGALAQKAIAEFKTFSEERRGDTQLFYGHMAYGLHDYFPQGATYFTVLRHPVERVISFYYFVRRNDKHYLHDFSLEETTDLATFAQSGHTNVTDNFQVRLVSGIWDDVPFGGLTEEHLALAKQVLREKIEVFGLTERFDETLLFLKDAFGWPNIWYRSRNVTKNRPQQEAISAEMLQSIAEQNHWDMELYAYAQTLFAEQVAARGRSFQRRLWWLRVGNRPMYVLWHGQRYVRGKAAYLLHLARSVRLRS